MHTVKTTIVTSASGEITGYGLAIEAETSGDAAEIAAAIRASLDMLRDAITTQIMPQPAASPPDDPPAGYAPAEPPPAPRAYTPPASPEEAEQRFFARYAETIGGQDWPAVQRYLRSHAPKPTTVDGWISVAESVRDQARAEQPQPAATRRSARRAA